MFSSDLVKQWKVHFISLGCARNLVDTEVMLGIVLQQGFAWESDLKVADFIVVNTCGFLSSARDEAYEVLDECFSQKSFEAKVVVAGCMVQKFSAELYEKFPNIHSMVSAGEVDKILLALEGAEQGSHFQKAKSYLQQGEVPRSLTTPKHYAYLKIAEGCAKQCAFCLIPSIKGALQSKPVPQVIREFSALLDLGVQEIILIAQDLGDWGKDFSAERKGRLEHLLQEMLKDARNFWLRLLYLYPDEISDQLIQLMVDNPRICPYLDMPIQHVNDDILRKMRRKTNKKDICTTIEKLRKSLPDVVIRTSLMVGFPGESDEHFSELMQFISDYPLDNVGVFSFSAEEGTVAAQMPNQVPEEVKQERYHCLMEKQLGIVQEKNKIYLGRTLEVLVEGYHPDSKLLIYGRFFGQSPEIDGVVIINDYIEQPLFGGVYLVKITDVLDYDLVGQVMCLAKGYRKPAKSQQDLLPIVQ